MADTFKGTKGGGGHVMVYAFDEATLTVGALEVEFTLIGGSGPKEQDNGLFDLEFKHIHLTKAVTDWAKVAAPFSSSSVGTETYDVEDGPQIGGSTSTSPTKLFVWIGALDDTTDPDNPIRYTVAQLFKLARGSRDHTTARGKYNELNSKFVGEAPKGNVPVVAAKYGTTNKPAQVTAPTTTNITTSTGKIEEWYPAV